MLFKPTVKSVSAKKIKALSVFEKARTQLFAAVDEFKKVIDAAMEKKIELADKIAEHNSDIVAAQKEIVAVENTISKINNIVGA